MTEIQRDLARAQAMLDVKRHDEAASLLARVVASNPENGRAWCLLAAANLGATRYREAADAANQAVAVSPSDEWAHRLVSIANFHLRDGPAAVRAAKEACRLAPEEWQAWVCLAQAALVKHRVPYRRRQENVAVAERAAETARRLAPDQADAYYLSGRASFAGSYFGQARIYQEKALALNPTHGGALNELGRINLKQQSWRSSADYFVRAARASPEVGTYSQNVFVTIWAVILPIICLSAYATFAVAAFVFEGGKAQALAAPELGGVCFVSAMLTTWRLLALPPAVRPLLRTRRVAWFVGAVYGSLVLAIIVSAADPLIGRWAVLAAAGALVIALVYLIVRARRPSTRLPAGRSQRPRPRICGAARRTRPSHVCQTGPQGCSGRDRCG